MVSAMANQNVQGPSPICAGKKPFALGVAKVPILVNENVSGGISTQCQQIIDDRQVQNAIYLDMAVIVKLANQGSKNPKLDPIAVTANSSWKQVDL